MTAPDILNLAAQHRYELPSEWRWRSSEALDGGFLLAGAAPIGTFQRGPRKGQPKFPPRSAYRRVVITHQDVAETRARWEAETGLCSRCGGTGQEVAGWSATTGTKYRTCRACNGTGKPVQFNPI